MIAEARTSARLRTVDEHIARENEHDLDGIMATFGETARYDDEAWDTHHAGRDEVRAFYKDLLHALPDLRIDVQGRHIASDAIILEVVIRGRHLSTWRGLPATGRQVEFPLCAVFTFDDKDRLAGERIYYDSATVLRQLGMFHEPERLLGQIAAVLTHPITIARVAARKLREIGTRRGATSSAKRR